MVLAYLACGVVITLPAYVAGVQQTKYSSEIFHENIIDLIAHVIDKACVSLLQHTYTQKL